MAEEAEEAAREIGDLLGRLWTKLGGNYKQLTNTQGKYHALLRTGKQTLAMKRLVSNVQDELHDLQVNCEALRGYAMEPLLTEGHVSKNAVIRTLGEGCRGLKSRLKGFRDVVPRAGDAKENIPLVFKAISDH